MNELLDSFNEYFNIVPANCPELREEVFRIRYQVYCKEIKIAGPDVCNNRKHLETDAYDERSIHCLLRHRTSGEAVGVVRLILADRTNPDEPFPVEVVAGGHFNRQIFNPENLPRIHTAEISRLIVASHFRKRKGEFSSEIGNDESIRKPRGAKHHFPHPVLGLFVAVMRMSAEQRLSHLYAAMEPVLNRLLRRFGVDLQPIGSTVQYHGLRQPFIGEITAISSKLKSQCPDMWHLITDGGRLLKGVQN